MHLSSKRKKPHPGRCLHPPRQEVMHQTAVCPKMFGRLIADRRVRDQKLVACLHKLLLLGTSMLFLAGNVRRSNRIVDEDLTRSQTACVCPRQQSPALATIIDRPAHHNTANDRPGHGVDQRKHLLQFGQRRVGDVDHIFVFDREALRVEIVFSFF